MSLTTIGVEQDERERKREKRGIADTVTTDNGLKAECFVMVQLPSGINSVGADGGDVSVYTLSGQRLAAPRKGINIVGGKKDYQVVATTHIVIRTKNGATGATFGFNRLKIK